MKQGLVLSIKEGVDSGVHVKLRHLWRLERDQCRQSWVLLPASPGPAGVRDRDPGRATGPAVQDSVDGVVRVPRRAVPSERSRISLIPALSCPRTH